MRFCNIYITISGVKTIVQTFAKHLKSFDDIKEKAYPMVSIVILMITEYLVMNLKFANDYLIYIVLLNGFLFGYMSSKLIVSTMAKVIRF
jgi:hypothetical protein